MAKRKRYPSRMTMEVGGVFFTVFKWPTHRGMIVRMKHWKSGVATHFTDASVLDHMAQISWAAVGNHEKTMKALDRLRKLPEGRKFLFGQGIALFFIKAGKITKEYALSKK